MGSLRTQKNMVVEARVRDSKSHTAKECPTQNPNRDSLLFIHIYIEYIYIVCYERNILPKTHSNDYISFNILQSKPNQPLCSYNFVVIIRSPLFAIHSHTLFLNPY